MCICWCVTEVNYKMHGAKIMCTHTHTHSRARVHACVCVRVGVRVCGGGAGARNDRHMFIVAAKC